MPFPPKREHRLSIDQASAMTRRFRNDPRGVEIAQMFPRAELETLLNQAGAAGIRFYFARAEAGGSLGLVAVAVDKEGNDMTSGVMIDMGFPCPPWCGDGNQLNS